MAKIRFIGHDGTETEVDASEGVTIMQTAVSNGVAGIDAECGGALSCATCHVFFDPEWSSKLEEPKAMEKDMLEFVVDPQESSRLSCQIKMSEELDGIVVRTPESQY